MRYNKNVFFGGLVALSLISSPALAAVSASEASRLGSDLTPFGSPIEGNASGTIPAWTGGLTPNDLPADYEGTGDHHPDPFPEDEVLFTISASNMDQYAEHLSEGLKAMLETYPTSFRI